MKVLVPCVVVALAGLAGLSLAQPGSQPAATEGSQPPASGRQAMNSMGQKLLDGLRATPGCLGADAAQTQSGKNVIFGWFENKAAAMAWYNSPTHSFMRMAMTVDGGGDGREPMADVPDNIPIMAIASLKMIKEGDGQKPLPGMRMPISEIAIELYTPLPGGLRYAGGFTPEGLRVEGRMDLGPDGQPLKPAAAPAAPASEPPAAPVR
jgi:quinol monooxygenase YgiN